jgi:hypothetical protein
MMTKRQYVHDPRGSPRTEWIRQPDDHLLFLTLMVVVVEDDD